MKLIKIVAFALMSLSLVQFADAACSYKRVCRGLKCDYEYVCDTKVPNPGVKCSTELICGSDGCKYVRSCR